MTKRERERKRQRWRRRETESERERETEREREGIISSERMKHKCLIWVGCTYTNTHAHIHDRAA